MPGPKACNGIAWAGGPGSRRLLFLEACQAETISRPYRCHRFRPCRPGRNYFGAPGGIGRTGPRPPKMGLRCRIPRRPGGKPIVTAASASAPASDSFLARMNTQFGVEFMHPFVHCRSANLKRCGQLLVHFPLRQHSEQPALSSGYADVQGSCCRRLEKHAVPMRACGG